jgi:hypothetical protein
MSPATAPSIVRWPVWIGLTAAGFLVAAGAGLFWPLGLAILICLIWSGKMMCCMGPMAHWKDEARKVFDVGRRGYGSTGNAAFDAYRDTTLKRLEEEQRAFAEFLSQLRSAKDREEFERFMAERTARQAQ